MSPADKDQLPASDYFDLLEQENMKKPEYTRQQVGTALASAGFAATYIQWEANGAPDDEAFRALDRFELFNPDVGDTLTEQRYEEVLRNANDA